MAIKLLAMSCVNSRLLANPQSAPHGTRHPAPGTRKIVFFLDK